MDLYIRVHARRHLPSAVPWISEDRLLVTPLNGHSIFISAQLSTDAVSALSPKGLGINKTEEATMRPSTHVNMRRVRPGYIYIYIYIYIEREKDRQTDRQTNRQIDRDRETESSVSIQTILVLACLCRRIKQPGRL